MICIERFNKWVYEKVDKPTARILRNTDEFRC